MTYSIIAYDENSDTIGVAAATGNMLVGQFVPHCIHGIGAVASQGYIPNPYLATQCLIQLAKNKPLSVLFNQLEINSCVQLTVMNMQGKSMNFSGENNLDYTGANCEDCVAVSGNWLKNEDVLNVMLKHYKSQKNANLGQRLLGSLESAYQAGSDVRGTFSAALKLDDGKSMPIDLRVDYNYNPINELKNLFKRWSEPGYQKFLNTLPDVSSQYYCNLYRQLK